VEHHFGFSLNERGELTDGTRSTLVFPDPAYSVKRVMTSAESMQERPRICSRPNSAKAFSFDHCHRSPRRLIFSAVENCCKRNMFRGWYETPSPKMLRLRSVVREHRLWGKYKRSTHAKSESVISYRRTNSRTRCPSPIASLVIGK
jgi:hypothetical protein